MIPKIIHFVWVGKQKPPPRMYSCWESFSKTCPDYEIKLWNDGNIAELNLPEEYNFSKNPAQKSDFIRYACLKKYGGFYLDSDMHSYKNLDGLLEYDFISAIENDKIIAAGFIGSVEGGDFVSFCNEKLVEHLITIRDMSRNEIVDFCSKHNMLTESTNAWFSNEKNTDRIRQSLEGGPLFLTYMYSLFENKENHLIMSDEIYKYSPWKIPYEGAEKDMKTMDDVIEYYSKDESNYMIHLYAGTWI